MSHPLGAAADTPEISSSKGNFFATAYLALAGMAVPLLCILVELLDDHPCRRHTGMDPLQYPWQGISVVAVSVTHLAYFLGWRKRVMWPLLAWSLLICCGYTVWFAPVAPRGLRGRNPSGGLSKPVGALSSSF